MTKKRYAKLMMASMTELVNKPTITKENHHIMCRNIYKIRHHVYMPCLFKSYAQMWETWLSLIKLN